MMMSNVTFKMIYDKRPTLQQNEVSVYSNADLCDLRGVCVVLREFLTVITLSLVMRKVIDHGSH